MTTTDFIARLDSRALVRVEGADWRAFLQGLLTNDVETLAPGEARFAGLLTPQGRLLYDLFVVGTAQGCLLDVAAEHREALALRLKMYRLRAKVDIEVVDTPVFAGSTPFPLDGGRAGDGGVRAGPSEGTVQGDSDGASRARQTTAGAHTPYPALPPSRGKGSTIPDPRLPALGWRFYNGDITPTADEEAYDAHRLALGVPGPADWGSDKTYPIEANFDLLNGIDFHKGCFVGQETTSRMKRRGTVKNRMLPIAFDGPPPPHGAEILAGTLRAGEVLSGRQGRAMALVRLDRIEGADLAVDGRSVRVERPDWFTA